MTCKENCSCELHAAPMTPKPPGGDLVRCPECGTPDVTDEERDDLYAQRDRLLADLAEARAQLETERCMRKTTGLRLDARTAELAQVRIDLATERAARERLVGALEAIARPGEERCRVCGWLTAMCDEGDDGNCSGNIARAALRDNGGNGGCACNCNTDGARAHREGCRSGGSD